MYAGWTDPILAAALGPGTASQVRLAFAWPNATAPMETFGKNASQLSHKDDLLIFERNITTGNTAAQDIPQQVRRHFPVRLTQETLKARQSIRG